MTRAIQQNVDNGVTGKRKRTTKMKPAAPRAKKARVTKTKEETEYLEETRNLEDLWKVAFPIGIEWDKFDALYEFNWDFRNLEQALEEGGLFYGKKVFVFVTPEPQFVTYKDTSKVVDIPTVVAIESPFPPSDKLGEVSIQSAKEEIFPMKQMKMDWLPYIPFENRDRQVDRINFQIFILGCTQRKSALRHLKEERARVFEFCLPYLYNPFAADELEVSTVVDIVFPSEPPVVCDFDWEFNDLEEFVDNLIEEESLSAEQKDEFKAKDGRKKAKEELSEDTKQAFQNIKFYKFYPQPSPDVPSFKTSPFMNRYYRNAHQVL